MYEKKLYLNENDLEAVINLLERFSKTMDYTFTTSKLVMAYTKSKLEIPSHIEAKIKFNDGYVININLTEVSDEVRYIYKRSFVLTFQDSANMRLPYIDNLAHEIQEALSNEIPPVFRSMEHFQDYLKIPTSSSLSQLTDNLLLTAMSAVDSVMVGFTKREKIHFESTEMREALSYCRVEVKEDEFSKIEISNFQVYTKCNIAIAIGIMQDRDDRGGNIRYALYGWFDAKHSELLMKNFGENFEKALVSGISMKGMKLTGTQKIIKLKEKLTLDDIVLEDSIKDKIVKEIINFFDMEMWYKKAGLPFKRGVALYGTFGTGKTHLCKILASIMSQSLIWVKAGEMQSLGDMDRVFRIARMGSPSILFLEDIDFYSQDRESGRSSGLGLANLLAQLDGVEENHGVLTIITTNRIESIEKAIVDRPSRIDVKIHMGELGKEKIVELVRKKLDAFSYGFYDWDEVIPKGTLLTGAQAVELSTMILRNAISDKKPDDTQDVEITEDAVKKALKDIERVGNGKKVAGFATTT